MSLSLADQVERLQLRVAQLEGVAERPILPSMRRIIRTVAAHYRVAEVHMLGAARVQHIVLARHMAMSLCRELHGHSMPRIGRAFGRDHTSVLSACRRIEALRAGNPDLNHEWEALARELTASRPAETQMREV